MSQATFVPSPRAQTTPTTETITDDATVELILDTLDDADCRCILDATDGEALSASEIAETCDLPLSTAYRKLDPLAEAGLLSKNLRICRSGKHTAEYERAVGDVFVSVSPAGLEVRVARESGDDGVGA